jgi:hypothetical protein
MRPRVGIGVVANDYTFSKVGGLTGKVRFGSKAVVCEVAFRLAKVDISYWYLLGRFF